jgi:hypothetical protein
VIETIVVISLSIFGLHYAMNGDGMILNIVPDLLFWLPEFIRKPLFECVVCMASFWSLVFWFFLDFNLIITILAVAGLNSLLLYFYDL